MGDNMKLKKVERWEKEDGERWLTVHYTGAVSGRDLVYHMTDSGSSLIDFLYCHWTDREILESGVLNNNK